MGGLGDRARRSEKIAGDPRITGARISGLSSNEQFPKLDFPKEQARIFFWKPRHLFSQTITPEENALVGIGKPLKRAGHFMQGTFQHGPIRWIIANKSLANSSRQMLPPELCMPFWILREFTA